MIRYKDPNGLYQEILESCRAGKKIFVFAPNVGQTKRSIAVWDVAAFLEQQMSWKINHEILIYSGISGDKQDIVRTRIIMYSSYHRGKHKYETRRAWKIARSKGDSPFHPERK